MGTFVVKANNTLYASIIDFAFMPKITEILSKDLVPPRCKFPTVNIKTSQELNYNLDNFKGEFLHI